MLEYAGQAAATAAAGGALTLANDGGGVLRGRGGGGCRCRCALHDGLQRVLDRGEGGQLEVVVMVVVVVVVGVFVVLGDEEDDLDAAAEGGDVGLERTELEGFESFDEVGEEVGAVVAA